MIPNITIDVPLKCATFNHGVVISVLYFVMFPIALVLNGVAAWVSLHLRATSTFMVYLKNLVAADLLMTLIIPIKAASDLPDASVRLRKFVCCYFSIIFYTCMYTSICLMGLVSLDRFFKIIRPCGRLLGQNLVFGKIISALVWVILFGGTAFPNMILSNEPLINKTYNSCISLKGPAGVRFHEAMVIFMNVLFWIVSALVAVCYICIANKVLQSFRKSGSSNSQGKQKTNLRVFLILIVFLVCFGPYHLVKIPYTLQQIKNHGACAAFWGKFLKDLGLLISTTNICLDPFLYFFLCREFSEKLISMNLLPNSFRRQSKGHLTIEKVVIGNDSHPV